MPKQHNNYLNDEIDDDRLDTEETHVTPREVLTLMKIQTCEKAVLQKHDTLCCAYTK